MPKMIKVQATRTFQAHTRGDILLVEQTAEIELLVKAKLFDVLAIENPVPEPAPPVPAKAKAKPKAKAKKAAKNV